MKKIPLTEPKRGYDYLQWGSDIIEKHPELKEIASVGADVFVLIYPIFLLILYVSAIVKRNKENKQGALFIFLSTFISVVVNILIQCFFTKQRPIVLLENMKAEETLLHEYLPTSSFPSDHAVVSMSFAMATLVRGIATKKKWMIRCGVGLILISLIMTECRMLTLVHWPTDILGGLFLGMLIPSLLIIKPIRNLFTTYIINPIIKLEEFIVKKIFKY